MYQNGSVPWLGIAEQGYGQVAKAVGHVGSAPIDPLALQAAVLDHEQLATGGKGMVVHGTASSSFVPNSGQEASTIQNALDAIASVTG